MAVIAGMMFEKILVREAPTSLSPYAYKINAREEANIASLIIGTNLSIEKATLLMSFSPKIKKRGRK